MSRFEGSFARMLLWLAVAGGCSRSGSYGPSAGAAATLAGAEAAAGNHALPPDAGPALSDASAPTPASSLANCTTVIGTCPAQDVGLWPLLIDATQFGAAARFVAMGGQAVLVALAPHSYSVVRLVDPNSGSKATVSWTFPSGDLEGIAVTDRGLAEGSVQTAVFALACDGARTQCSVLRGEVGQSTLAIWQALPAGFVPRGLVVDVASEPRALCAFGNGLICLRDSWQVAIANTPGLQLNDVGMGLSWSVAAGDHGRWFKRERDASGALGQWQEQATLGDVALTRVSVADAGAVLLGAGRIQSAVGKQHETYDCTPAKELAGLTLFDGIPGVAYAVASNGEVLQFGPVSARRREPYCAYLQLPMGTVIATASVSCEGTPTPRALTDRGLFGPNVCVHL